MSSRLQLDGCHHQSVVAPSDECLRGKGRHAWCNLQVKLCYPCLSALTSVNLMLSLFKDAHQPRRARSQWPLVENGSRADLDAWRTGGVVKIWVPLMDTDYARPGIAATWARLKDAYCSCKFG